MQTQGPSTKKSTHAILTHQGADSRGKRKYNPVACENKDPKHSRLNKMRRQENMVQMKEQGKKKKKKTQDQINKEEIGNIPEKKSEKS